MEKLPNKDIERMITFIKHEAEEKVKELEIRAIQEYNTEKAKYIKTELENIQNDFVHKQKQLEISKLREESNIINKYKLELVKKKNDMISDFFNYLEQAVCTEKLTEELINESASKINSTEFIAMCNEKDKKLVRKILGNIEIKDLPDLTLGGLILISKDKKTIVDNSFKTRIDSIKKFYCSEIVKTIFK